MKPKAATTSLPRSSTIALLGYCLIAAVAPMNAHAQEPQLACAQHTVVNGVHHQPTMADLQAGLAVCGVASPVDTSPEFGRAIDEINNTLLDAPRD